MLEPVYTSIPVRELEAGDVVLGAGGAMWKVVTTPAVYTDPTLGPRARFRMRRLEPWEDPEEGSPWESAADASWWRLEPASP